MVTVGGEAKGVEGEFCFRLWERPLHFLSCPVGNAHIMTTPATLSQTLGRYAMMKQLGWLNCNVGCWNRSRSITEPL